MPRLHYVTQDEPGISRIRVGKKFEYHSNNGKKITNEKILQRIKSLVIPPRYQNVWICKTVNGHIQAYGYDDLNRKQYIYHPQWTKAQGKKKFDHLLEFGLQLPHIRTQVSKDLNQRGLSKSKMVALAIKLLDLTSIRIGSPQYDSYGLLTLHKKHLSFKNNKLLMDFEGKSKQAWHLEITDKKLVNIFKILLKEKGYHVFEFTDNAQQKIKLKAQDVKEYLQAITQKEITAKEFRTWRATAYFLSFVLDHKGKCSEVKLRGLIDKVAKFIKNTPAVCRNSYIHPLIMKLYMKKLCSPTKKFKHYKNLSKAEDFLIYLLQSN